MQLEHHDGPQRLVSLLSEAFGAGGSTFSSGVSITVNNPPRLRPSSPFEGGDLVRIDPPWCLRLERNERRVLALRWLLRSLPVTWSARPHSTYYGWVYNWNTTTVPNGSYPLVSEAFDSGGSAFSSGVSITVHN